MPIMKTLPYRTPITFLQDNFCHFFFLSLGKDISLLAVFGDRKNVPAGIAKPLVSQSFFFYILLIYNPKQSVLRRWVCNFLRQYWLISTLQVIAGSATYPTLCVTPLFVVDSIQLNMNWLCFLLIVIVVGKWLCFVLLSPLIRLKVCLLERHDRRKEGKASVARTNDSNTAQNPNVLKRIIKPQIRNCMKEWVSCRFFWDFTDYLVHYVLDKG